MSEHIFGVTRVFFRQNVCEKLDRICREEGGHAFISIREPTHESKSWFTGPNYGHPFDAALEKRVIDRVRVEYPKLAQLAWPKPQEPSHD